MELKEKVVLKDKGEVKNLPTVKQLLVTLGWSSGVDLDLMAFYETKDESQPGGVFTENLGGSHGDLNAFPFIKLSGDAGVGKTSEGEETEELKIINLDHINKLYLVALNYTEAKKSGTNSQSSFSQFNGHIEIKDEAGNVFDVPLKNAAPGTVAHIATIDNTSAIGATVKMEDTVLQFNQFIESVPGARLLTK